MYISEMLGSRKNNFDFIRFLGSVLILFSHSFPLALGTGNKGWMFLLTNGQASLGNIAFYTFFIMSGFLITQSYDRSKDIVKFFQARILRIIPALIVVILMSTFIVGAIITDLSLIKYFSNINTYKYLASISLFKMQ